MAFTAYFAKASERLSAFIKGDVAFESPQCRKRALYMATPTCTQATTTYGNQKPLGQPLQVQSGYCVFRTAPIVSGGTATLLIEYIASDGTTATTIVAATTVLSKTDLVPFALTIAVSTTLAEGGSFRISITTSNNSVGTAPVGGEVVLTCYPVEDSAITESQT